MMKTNWPPLPEELERSDMRIRYRGYTLNLDFTRDVLTVHVSEPGIIPVCLAFKDEVHEFAGDSMRVFRLSDAGR
jgi:hypothetical protein